LNADLDEHRKPRILIFSCLRDKPITEMAQILFPLFDQVIIAPIQAARAAAIDDLLAAAQATGTRAITADSVSQALQIAASNADSGKIVVSGSVYLVGEARSLLLGEPDRQKAGRNP
jgi:dihydrofolate synthase/folylpolyglutamate synthase